jgi:hypothetical protein
MSARRRCVVSPRRGLGLIAMGLMAARIATAQSPCDCSDIRDLQGRYCQARAAIEEWDRLIRAVDSQQERSESIDLLTPGKKSDLAHCVDEVIGIQQKTFQGNDASGPVIQTRKASADTDADCNVTIKQAGTKCLEDLLQKHEKWHHDACVARSNPDAKADDDLNFLREIGRTINWRYSQSSMSYMSEERTGYSIEMADILKKLQDLFDRCPKAPFEMPKPGGGVKYSLTPCPPPPNMDNWNRTCKYP